MSTTNTEKISFAEGRKRALELGKSIAMKVLAQQQEVDRKRREEGMSEADINCMRHADQIRLMESQGLGTSHRCRVGAPQRQVCRSTKSVTELKPEDRKLADQLLAGM